MGSKQGASPKSAGGERGKPPSEREEVRAGRGGGEWDRVGGAECESGEPPHEPIRRRYLRSEATQEKPNR